MTIFQWTLRIMGSVIILIALGHTTLGPFSEVLLGSNISEASMLDPTVDSQNRFYGTVFSLFGVLLILCSRNLLANKTILYCVFWVFFAGGTARLVSIGSVGFPPLLVNILTGIELILPLILIVWLRALETKYGAVDT
ncbi:MAG: DUF4345 domain-containing protein [Pseudomonadaceae bacterium]|nr:DUF4345 domain-containing protein [Pseudomonadaceae bacterium]